MFITFLRSIAVEALTMKGFWDVRCMLLNAERARKVNDRLLLKILRQNKNCEYGKKYHFDNIKSTEDFKKNVPVVKYNDISDYIDRIYYTNEQNLITSKKIAGFATSSGSVGKPKLIPRTSSEVRIYTKYTVTRFLSLAKKYGKKYGLHLKPARGVCTLCQHKERSPHGLISTNVADIAAKRYYSIYPYILNLPLGHQFSADEIDIRYANARFGLQDRDCCYLFSVFAKNIAELIEYIIDNREMLLNDIENGIISESVKMKDSVRRELEKVVKPDPKRAAELRAEFEKPTDETFLKRIWPNLAVISAIGTSVCFEGFSSFVCKYSKGVQFDYSIYGASEGLVAAAYKPNEKGQLLLPDSCYYEFVEESEEEREITETLSLDELEVGKNYEILLTNQSGLYRYRINDIIRVLGYEGQCPVINFVYRRGQLLNINGEKTDIEQMSAAVKMMEQELQIEITEWAVFIDKGKEQYRYGILLETKDGIDLSYYAERFEEHLRNVNTSYRYYEEVKGLIDPPVIYNQAPGTHQAWREYKISCGATPEQVKPVKMLDNEEKMKFFMERIIK